MTSCVRVAIAVGLVTTPVPGATPKNPASGLIARSRPSGPGRIHAMSSPIVSTVQPGMVGRSIARLVLPHADGNAAATWNTRPWSDVTLRMSMCSASQPSSWPMTDAMRSAKHFLPSSAFPPYPEPNDQISRDSGNCTMYLVVLHGHGTSSRRRPSASTSGIPTECRAGTNAPSSPSRSSTSVPVRVMTAMLTTTYGESVSWTPSCEMAPPSGPIENGTTNIVRPRIEPAKTPRSSARISSGSRQLLVGPASSACAEQMNVRSSTRATSLGSERAR
jgi:hypothetical protein